MKTPNSVYEAVKKLDKWLDKSKWKGYDPYDIKALPLFVWLQKHSQNPIISNFQLVLTVVADIFPAISRKLLGIRPQENAKAMALLARGYLKLYGVTTDSVYFSKASRAINWLLNHNHAHRDGWLGWGYPFDWQSLIFIPANTPLVVVSALGGHAILDMYEVSRETKWLEPARAVRNFLLEGLNVSENHGTVSFSYSPLDEFKVINSTLYAASFLARIGKLYHDKRAIEVSRKARRFALEHQRSDGAWEYWADRPSIVDVYHHGITLEWLHISMKYDEPLSGEKEALDKGIDYFLKNFIGREGECKFTDRKKYPIDIHGVAQCIVTLSMLLPCQKLTLLDKVLKFALTKMRNRDGSFIYRIFRFNLKSKIPYLRWGQAWMLWALANYIERTASCAELSQ